jgi:hypothetical protein
VTAVGCKTQLLNFFLKEKGLPSVAISRLPDAVHCFLLGTE